ncbi:MAG: ABC transporter permease [Bacteroidales bacterium]|nr:ABC transporter permease [Bacteroidales bacterium]
MKNLRLIIAREYLERVKTKSFIISTILMPILMLAMMFVLALVIVLAEPENKVIAVVDYSQQISPSLKGDGELQFEVVNPVVPLDSVKRDDQYDAILVIGSDIVENPNNIQLYTHTASSMATEQAITRQIEKRIESIRIDSYNIENLEQILKAVQANVSLSTYRLDQAEEKETSSMLAYLIGLAFTMMLYMFILIYGQMVMTSIIEEKNNRVLEIVVSSVKPYTLMMGKIMGVGLVAVTQILIWGIVMAALSFWGVPMVTSMVKASGEMDLISILNQLSDVGYILSLLGYAILFLIGGYLLYSSFFAAIGSAVDNVQDASQLTSIAMIPIFIGLIIGLTVSTDPNSSMAFWTSMIPLTSPLIMMERIPFGIPAWQIWVSLVVLYASFIAMIWVCAKIYRVGIFMYGKKPSMAELVRWARYK